MRRGMRDISAAIVWTLLVARLVGPCACCADELKLTVNKPALSVKSGDAFVVTVALPRPTDFEAKVFDSQGKYVRTLAAKHAADPRFQIPWNMKDADGKEAAPGSYTIRVQTGFTLTADRSFGKEGMLPSEFISPWDIKKDARGNIYLLDGGAAILYKFHEDGTPAKDLGGKDTITASSSPSWLTVAIGPDGRIYLPAGHGISVYDPKSAAMLYYVGGFFEDAEWKKEKGGIGYPHWVGINGDHLYASSPSYAMLCCWDARKQGKAGGLWMVGRAPGGPSVGWTGDTDGKSAVYLAVFWRNGLAKLVETAASAEQQYSVSSYFDPAQKKIVEAG